MIDKLEDVVEVERHKYDFRDDIGGPDLAQWENLGHIFCGIQRVSGSTAFKFYNTVNENTVEVLVRYDDVEQLVRDLQQYRFKDYINDRTLQPYQFATLDQRSEFVKILAYEIWQA